MRTAETLASGCCVHFVLIDASTARADAVCEDCKPSNYDDIDWSFMSDPGEDDVRTISIALANKHLKYVVGYVRKAAEDSFDGDVYRTLHALATQLELVI